MSELKYHVGDRVLIKSLDWYNENKDEDGDVPCNINTLFVASNKKYLGTIQTIERVYKCKGRYANNYIYHMTKIDNVDWTDEMIEGLVEEGTKPKFKIGDRVITNKGYIGKFEGWVSDYQVRVLFPESGCNVVIHPKDLKLVEDEPNIDLAVKGEEVKERIEITIPKGYEYVIESDKIIFTKKKKEYPKTYEECLKVLGYDDIATHCIFHNEADEKLFNTLYDLKVCRDAYWKMAGEEMGLGKPWEPSDSDYITGRYCIFVHQGNIICSTPAEDCPFTFPTEEMRDAFKENFDPDLEICKELL